MPDSLQIKGLTAFQLPRILRLQPILKIGSIPTDPAKQRLAPDVAIAICRRRASAINMVRSLMIGMGEKTAFEGHRNCFGSIRDLQLLQDVVDIVPNRIIAEI